MSVALIILLGLLSLCPAIVTVDGAVLPCLIPLLLAAGLTFVSVNLPRGEAQHLSEVVSRPFVIIAGIPAVLMIIQVLPLPFLENPVWTSVSAGFPQGITGSVTIDTGATVITLGHYLSAVGAILLTAAVAINRDRAESVLVGTTAAAVLISFAFLIHDLFAAAFPIKREEALDCACLGMTLSAACGVLIFERQETRRYKPTQYRQKFLFAPFACLSSFLICAGAVATTRSGSLAFAAASGLAIFAAVVVIRRFALGRLGAVAIGTTAAIIAAVLVTVAATDPDPRLAFVKKDAVSIELTQRILSDAPAFGHGAGTLGALLPIYRSSSTSSRSSEAVTSAAKLSIETGKATLWFAIVAAAFIAYILLRGASERGRDSFYAAGAGACLVMLMILAFVNNGLSGTALTLQAATILGLGLTQSKSRAVS
ncbi:MAG: hypothetical protein L0Y60_06360 [Beijerinckiaceae bacterium]|nr:hypothetical protein [Beijerinckiaceae bacterium]